MRNKISIRGTRIAAGFLLGFLVGFSIYQITVYYNGPIFNNGAHCNSDTVPVLINDDFERCADPDETLKENEVFDPLGNRPFECDNRHGWEPIINEAGERDCFKKTNPLTLPPAGWKYVNYIITT